MCKYVSKSYLAHLPLEGNGDAATEQLHRGDGVGALAPFVGEGVKAGLNERPVTDGADVVKVVVAAHPGFASAGERYVGIAIKAGASGADARHAGAIFAMAGPSGAAGRLDRLGASGLPAPLARVLRALSGGSRGRGALARAASLSSRRHDRANLALATAATWHRIYHPHLFCRQPFQKYKQN